MKTAGLLEQRRGAVSILFATTAIPLAMCVGLAIDFSFYVQAQSQLTLAADAGAMHAVRIASQHFVQGESVTQADADGVTAGQQWFEAQLGPLTTGVYTPGSVNVSIIPPPAGTTTFTSNVTYKVTIPTHFGNLFNAVLSWPLGGSSSAVITTNSFVQIDMLIDNSSSMLIGTQPSDIKAIQNLTICPPQTIAAVTGHGGNGSNHQGGGYAEYSWVFPGSPDSNHNTSAWGFDPKGVPTHQTLVPIPSVVVGVCDPLFTGDPGECPYPPSLPGMINETGTYLPAGIAQPVDAAGFCPANTGTPDQNDKNLDPLTGKTRNIPQAPCGFACHSDKTPNDYYTLVQNAKSHGASISLRFDVVQEAAAQVVGDMITAANASGVPNQFSLGVFTFNSAIAQVHPQPGGPFKEADSDLAQGLADTQAITVPPVADNPNTNFVGAMSYLANNVGLSGDGSTPSTPRKNMFIVTDGLEDYPPGGARLVGQMTSPLNETVCQPLKAKGYTIYVLYTPYYALPNPFYLYDGARVAVEQPVSNPASVAAGLQACASNPSYYYQASSKHDIDTAMAAMLASALNTPGRLAR